ncbi:hypothetical protein V6N11_031337 [Hibiscus sabdariffa]|uniref:Uncharacterized protein n=1 Tax=Hibiscus sabdariffa TaxID=183260 RepID=A0ABR2SXC1_9ROSI
MLHVPKSEAVGWSQLATLVGASLILSFLKMLMTWLATSVQVLLSRLSMFTTKSAEDVNCSLLPKSHAAAPGITLLQAM